MDLQWEEEIPPTKLPSGVKFRGQVDQMLLSQLLLVPCMHPLGLPQHVLGPWGGLRATCECPCISRVQEPKTRSSAGLGFCCCFEALLPGLQVHIPSPHTVFMRPTLYVGGGEREFVQ